MKFTIYEFERALRLTDTGQSKEALITDVIAELTKPEWKPEAGEVYWCANGINNGYEAHDPIHHIGSSSRCLTLAEHGPDVRAMQDVLRKISHSDYPIAAVAASLVLEDHEIK